MSKVGNQTNSQDPQAVNSRVFVGNLNTFQCSKTDVERMFQRYGRLAGEQLLKHKILKIFIKNILQKNRLYLRGNIYLSVCKNKEPWEFITIKQKTI